MQWMLMPLRRYADFSGRSRRREYWMFYLFNLLIALAVGALFAVTFLIGMSETEMNMIMIMMPVFVVYAIVALAFIIPGIAVTIRRLHDTDHSGWFLLLSLVPLVGPIVLLIFYCTQGTPGPNRFGPDPKATERQDAPIFA